jgi:3-oxoacyl-[acyl-carrier protein] reductase
VTGPRPGKLGLYDLQDRVALVVGGSSGIGAATARRLAAAGAHVIVGYRSGKERAEAVLAELDGHDRLAVHVDLLDSDTLTGASEQIVARFGRLDVLVNSAGTTVRVPHGDLDALDDATFDQILAANVRGPFATVRALLPLLRASGEAVVVNVSSISGFTGSGSNVAYCASKAGLDSVTRSLGRALGPDIRFVSVSPAAVDTDFVPGRGREAIRAQAASTPLHVIVDPDDVAVSILGVITHLRITTGAVVVTDGGKFL